MSERTPVTPQLDAALAAPLGTGDASPLPPGSGTGDAPGQAAPGPYPAFPTGPQPEPPPAAPPAFGPDPAPHPASNLSPTARTLGKSRDRSGPQDAYVYGTEIDGEIQYPTLEQVAERFRLPFKTIKRWSAKDGWLVKREQAKADLALQRGHQKVRKLHRAGEQFTMAFIATAQATLAGLALKFKHITGARERAVKEGRTDLVALTTGELRDISNTLRSLMPVAERFLPMDPKPEPPVRVGPDGRVIDLVDTLDAAIADKLRALPTDKFVEALDKLLPPPPGFSLKPHG